ncbi:MAG: iron chelate uptake ABC transporter family permease subunit [Alphaproteobacteria bacterium]|nr:iron chelate uptake ABC transporter family permease subunit [Alphaproteobacteria bacterium]
MDPFILHAWLAGLGIALASAPVGCFIAWQRLVYFGDTVAHAALLGVVLGLVFGASPAIGIIFMAVMIALLVASLSDDFLLPSDTLLGILAHASLALGLVILSQSPSITLDVNGLLFGDILAANQQDLRMIFALAASVTLLLGACWKPLMRFVLHADIAQVEGVNTRRIRLMLMLLIALVVAVSIKLVGILLITSLLILPAAAARLLARSPGQMAIIATLLSMGAVTLGLAASLHFDTPTGPSIILSALAILMMLALVRRS